MTTPVEEHETRRGGGTEDRPVHWGCVTQFSPPIFALCGELPPRQRRMTRRRITCPMCADMVAGHVKNCAPCRIAEAAQ